MSGWDGGGWRWCCFVVVIVWVAYFVHMCPNACQTGGLRAGVALKHVGVLYGCLDPISRSGSTVEEGG